MRRRTAHLLAAALLAVSVAACSSAADERSGQRGPVAGQSTAGQGTPASPRASPANEPKTPAGTAPDKTFAVAVRELRLNRGGDRPLPVTVWYPGTGEPGGTPQHAVKPAAGRFPIVVFSHGLGGQPDDYAPLLSRWAAAGFVVAAPAYPHTSRGAARNDVLDVLNQPADASYVLTELLALDGRSDDPLRGHLATDRVAAAGHSAGGITTVGLFTVGRDERLDAGIVLAGSALGVGTAFTGPAAPQLFIHGRLDDVVSYAAGKAAYDQVPWPKAMLSLPDGDHGQSLLRTGSRAFGVVADTTVEFLRWSLYGDPAAKRRLPGDATRGGLASLDDHL
jgi:fermentation-respiration switch protein FrsA (DUF1100 family)